MVHYGWHAWGWGDWMAMILVMVLFWGVVVAVVVALFNYGRSRHFPLPPPAGSSPRDEARTQGLIEGSAAGSPGQSPGASAMEILDQRFARGEIDADEYTKRRDLLRSGS